MWKHYSMISCMRHEGFRSTQYKDSLGHPTIGYGHKIGPSMDWDGAEITHEIAAGMLRIDWNTNVVALLDLLRNSNPGVWDKQTGPRKAVIAEMAYVLGASGCLNFKRMWKAISAGDYGEAAVEMCHSIWQEQAFERVEVLAQRLSAGVYAGGLGE